MADFLSDLPHIPTLIGGVVLFILFAFILSYSVLKQSNKNSKDDALAKIFDQYPEIINQGHGQYYFFEQIGSSWYVGIGYGGKESQIEDGDCFRVDGDHVEYINSIKKLSSNITEINPVTCEGM